MDNQFNLTRSNKRTELNGVISRCNSILHTVRVSKERSVFCKYFGKYDRVKWYHALINVRFMFKLRSTYNRHTRRNGETAAPKIRLTVPRSVAGWRQQVLMGSLEQSGSGTRKQSNNYCPACRTTFIATRFRVAVICPIIPEPHCIRVFFYFVWFVFINHIFQFYYELCTYCNILDIYLS